MPDKYRVKVYNKLYDTWRIDMVYKDQWSAVQHADHQHAIHHVPVRVEKLHDNGKITVIYQTNH